MMISAKHCIRRYIFEFINLSDTNFDYSIKICNMFQIINYCVIIV